MEPTWVLSLHMGSYPVHIPPCRSHGCALTVVPGHTRSGADGEAWPTISSFSARLASGQYRRCLAANF